MGLDLDWDTSESVRHKEGEVKDHHIKNLRVREKDEGR